MTDIPTGWCWTTVERVAQLIRGVSYKKAEAHDEPSGELVPILRATNIGDLLTWDTGLVYVPSTRVSAEQYLVPGDIVLATSSGSASVVGKSASLTTAWQGSFGAFCAVLRAHEAVAPYLRYMVSSAEVRDRWSAASRGTNINNLKVGDILGTPIRLPPQAEQERIVAAIEEHFSRLDFAEASVKSAVQRSASLRATLLDSVWDSRWAKVRLGDLLAMPLANGRSVPTDPNGFPVLRLTALKERRVRLDQRKGGAWDQASARPFLVKRGDFLVSRGNGSLALMGRGGLVDGDPDPVAYPDTLIRIRVRPDEYSSRFLSLVWDSNGVRQQLEGSARTTAGIYKVNQEILREIIVPRPPLDEQVRVADWLESALDGTARLATAGGVADARSRALRRSILAAGLSGQLVSQDSADEPASYLIERIASPKRPSRRSVLRGA